MSARRAARPVAATAAARWMALAAVLAAGAPAPAVGTARGQEPAEAAGDLAGEPAAAEEAAAAGSDRARVVLRLDCASALSRRELTLFANGTLRLKAGRPGAEAMSLAELGPAELDDALALLAEIDLDETDPETAGPEGEWLERCALELALPGREPVVRRFKRFASLSLALARALAVVDGLAAGIEEPRARLVGGGPGDRGPARLPVGYEPAVGDLLRHADGALYRLVAFTADGEGVELQGVDQPLTLYLPRGRLAEVLIELVGRRERRGP